MKTKPSETVVVIGAGVGGLTAAIHLAKHGLQVIIVEKNAHPGGRCDRFSREGHHFNTGPTLLVMPELYASEFAALGKSVNDALELQRVDPTYHLVFDDGSQLALTSDMESMETQLEAIEPGSFQGLLRYLDEGNRFKLNFTPLSWHKRYNLVKGSTHGLCHNLTQLGFFRPDNRHPHFHNLYFTGASTRPGTGMPTAMVSGRHSAFRILDDLNAQAH